MNIRLQTWFPYHVQICLNGREWLRRSLEEAGMDFVSRRNKFFHIDGYPMAQRFLTSNLIPDWERCFPDLFDEVFPARTHIIGSYPSYYWTFMAE
jgi:hypothetical protein